MKALICGFGRAGKRHAAILQGRGFDVFIYDPNWVRSAGSNPKGFDLCVIAGPPHTHLDQLRLCATYGIPTMVEKPLCSIDENPHPLAHYRKVSVAYNYRYHPSILRLKEADKRGGTSWHFHSVQHRQGLPDWGIFLDHLPHTIDIALFVTGRLPEFKKATDESRKSYLEVTAKGILAGKPFTLLDRVSRTPVPKEAYIEAPGLHIEVQPDTGMFDRMWDDFLAENYTGLDEAIRVQAALQDAESCVKRRLVAV